MEMIICGKKMLYDKEDQDKVDMHTWHISGSGYAVWRGIEGGKKRTIRLHRLIAEPEDGMVVDHINRNKLDNRRSNLRCVTQAINIRNSDRVENAKGYYYSNSKCRGDRNWVVDCMGYSCTYNTEREAQKAVREIRKGTFVKPIVMKHNVCSRCGNNKCMYGGTWTCKKCALRRSKEYYLRKKRISDA